MTLEVTSNLNVLTNYNEFKSYVSKFGYSMANLYDIQFDLPGSSSLYLQLADDFGLSTEEGSPTLSDVQQLMRLYTTSCTMPGVTMSDSEYRITNTPQLKYAYGAVFNEFSVTFLMDANSNIRKLFDKWTNIIYPYSSFRGSGDGVLRTRYKDEYIGDITFDYLPKYVDEFTNSELDNEWTLYKTIDDNEL